METLVTSVNKWHSKNNDRFQTGSSNTWSVKQIVLLQFDAIGWASEAL